ncbi:MAG: hypothetical protein F4Z28_13395 [Gammaproteobacteria bacterium]|nr:hypothetical protein [Gammaproteobacteria bacterium]
MGFAELEAGLKAARERREREYDEPPVRCPIDGALLQEHPDDPDVRHCPMGNYTWRGEPGVGRDGLGVEGAF